MLRNIILIIAFGLLASCAQNKPIETNTIDKGHPIIGSWTFNIKGCDETYNFTPEGIRYVKSNKEVVESSYSITAYPLESGFYRITDKVLKDNGKEDCTGSTADMTNDVVTLYAAFSKNKGQLIFCFKENLNDCFGPFYKNN